MKALVTGGAGFIGSHVVDALLAAGHTVIAVDDLSRGRREHLPAAAPLVVCDVTGEGFAAVVAQHRPQIMFHLAAQIDVRHSVANPRQDASINVLGTLNVLQAAQAAGVQALVFSSTGGAIYGEQQAYPANEQHPCQPLSPYGVSKLCAEAYVGYAGRVGALRTVILRYSNVYGPRQDPHGEAGVVAIFADRLLAQEPLTLYGDGQQTRDFVYVTDVAHANLLALVNPQAHGVFNIGTGVETSVLALYEQMAHLSGSAAVAAVHAPARAGEQRRSVVDAAQAAAVLGWRPHTSLAHGLANTLSFFAARKRVAPL